MRAWIGAALALASCKTAPTPPPESAVERFPEAKPPANAALEVSQGHLLFVENCIRCHRINGQGGDKGPEPAHPRNVTEVWNDAQLLMLIRNPRDVGLKTMPTFIHLSPSELSAIIAYLKVMKSSEP
jgi:mono/diheme cytochrome c family protein